MPSPLRLSPLWLIREAHVDTIVILHNGSVAFLLGGVDHDCSQPKDLFIHWRQIGIFPLVSSDALEKKSPFISGIPPRSEITAAPAAEEFCPPPGRVSGASAPSK